MTDENESQRAPLEQAGDWTSYAERARAGRYALPEPLQRNMNLLSSPNAPTEPTQDLTPSRDEPRRGENQVTCWEWMQNNFTCTKDECQDAHYFHYFFPRIVQRAQKDGSKHETCEFWAGIAPSLPFCIWPSEVCGFAHESDYQPSGGGSKDSSELVQLRSRIKAWIKDQTYYARIHYVCKNCHSTNLDLDAMRTHSETCQGRSTVTPTGVPTGAPQVLPPGRIDGNRGRGRSTGVPTGGIHLPLLGQRGMDRGRGRSSGGSSGRGSGLKPDPLKRWERENWRS